MKKISTPTSTIHSETNLSDDSTPRPSKLTLNFIKQFARSYHCEQKVINPLCGIIVN